MPVGRYAFATCAYGEYIFVLGGLFELVQADRGQKIPDSLKRCDNFNVKRDCWTEMPDLPEARIGASAIVVGSVLYLIGGLGKSNNIFYYSMRRGED